jgi:hypothetical protein
VTSRSAACSASSRNSRDKSAFGRAMPPARSTVVLGLILALGLAAFGVSALGGTGGPADPATAQPVGERAVVPLAQVALDAHTPVEPTNLRETAPGVSATLRGRLVGEDGCPVGPGVVSVRGGGKTPRRIEIAADGVFELNGLEPGTWQLLARGPGFASTSVFAEDLEAGETRVQEIRVFLGVRVRGEVLGVDGRPLVGVRVTPWRRGPDGDELEPETSVETDRGGLFELGAGDARWCQVQVSLEGYAPRSVRVDASRFAQIRLSPRQE